MKWNLVDLLSEEGSEDPLSRLRRKFYLPLASIPPGISDFSRTLNVNKDLFNPTDGEGIPSNSHVLHIDIRPLPGNNFSDDGPLPDPAIRLHAMTDGFVRFKPATDTTPASLHLEMPTFQFPPAIRTKAEWWDRWMEADCIPHTVIYENVDRNALEAMLEAMPAGPPRPGLVFKIISSTEDGTPLEIETATRMERSYGLGFPAEVTHGNRSIFISELLKGKEGFFLIAEAGAYLGRAAAKRIDELNDPNSEKRLSLRVFYRNHTEVNPRYMNPREFFHLLFGDDSVESKGNGTIGPHPLLARINEKGSLEQTNEVLESKRMLLRPPLRTHARLVWEADKEVSNHSREWAQPFELDRERLFNRLEGFFAWSPKFKYRPASGRRETSLYHLQGWKCSLFVYEIALRSGYKVRLFRGSDNLLYYKFVSRSSVLVSIEQGRGIDISSDVRANDRYVDGYAPLLNSEKVLWGRRWAKRLDSIQSMADRRDEIKRMLLREGRCLLLIQSGRNSFGHIMLVESVEPDDQGPEWAKNRSLGLVRIWPKLLEAVATGARNHTPVSPKHGGASVGLELWLVELVPGKDPDTVYGLEGLNVR